MPTPERNSVTHRTHLISTKLAPPRLPRRLVHREDVLRMLELGVERKLTVLHAPAGFGKTTVLVDWRERLLATARLVAWITLDADDNDPNQLVAYLKSALGEALSQHGINIPELQSEDEIAPPKVALISILNALNSISSPVTLILDDVDRICDGPILDLLTFFILHAPVTMQFVMATRTDLPLALPYLRAQDELVEIDAKSMLFSIQDTHSFLKGLGSPRLDATQIRSLHEATEGWAAGLQMAAIALRDHADPARLIGSFSGTHRSVIDYLANAVLPNLKQEEVSFLLRTSILERFNGALCTHISGIENGTGMLERLSQQNLFIQTLDSKGQWFRYHALFADFLRDQLERRHPGQLKALHERAAQWFADHELWSEAVRHALAAERIDLASQWVELCAMREVEDSRVHSLIALARKLPEASTGARLRIALAWALVLTMQLDEAEKIVEKLSSITTDTERPAAENNNFEAELLSLRLCITALRDDTTAALAIGEQCLPWLVSSTARQTQGVWFTQAMLNGMTYCYMRAGDFERARAVQQAEYYPVLDDPTRNLFTLGYRACLLGGCDIQEGRLAEAAHRLRESLALVEKHAGRRSAAATLVACSMSTVHYEWDELEELDHLLADRLDLINEACFLDSVRQAYLVLARLCVARNDFEAAHGLLNRAELVARRRGWLRLTISALAEHLRLWLIEGRPLEAERTWSRIEALTDPQPPATPCAASETWRLRCVARARMHLHRGEAVAAIQLLQTVLEDEKPTRHPYSAVRTLTLLAIAFEQNGQTKPSLQSIETALRIAEPSAMIRSISDEGYAAAKVIKLLMSAGQIDSEVLKTPWFGKLRHALGLDVVTETSSEPVGKPDAGLLEALSQREHDVLTLVAQGLSNDQTARTLMLATETVKWHLKNIYGKLGVSSRTQAVHRARQINLISDPVSS